ncbi:MAG: hypothetical protein AAFR16_00865 [Pseudomonadota bacterium]
MIKLFAKSLDLPDLPLDLLRERGARREGRQLIQGRESLRDPLGAFLALGVDDLRERLRDRIFERERDLNHAALQRHRHRGVDRGRARLGEGPLNGDARVLLMGEMRGIRKLQNGGRSHRDERDGEDTVDGHHRSRSAVRSVQARKLYFLAVVF